MNKPAAATARVRIQRHRVHKGRRPVPGPDARVDTLLGMILALTSEVAVLRERLDAHERLSAAGRPNTPAEVNNYVPDEAVEIERAAQRQRLIDKVCRPMIAAGVAEPQTKGE